jgi:glucose/arabinose dehydrogenase
MIMKNYNISKPAMLICLLTLAFISCDTNIGQINTDDITLPPGFIMETYADVPNARSMALSENGILFVGTRSSDNVYAVIDNDNNFIADEIFVVASGLTMPNGVAIKDSALYVAEVSRILKYENIESTFRNNPSPVIVRDDFPTESHHGWKFIRFGPDGSTM